jgi:hypothetical protein
VTASSSEGKLCFYSVEALRKFHLEVGTAKPTKSIKSKCRFLCIAINHMRPEKVKKEIKKKKKVIGKKRKVDKDVKKIMQR